MTSNPPKEQTDKFNFTEELEKTLERYKIPTFKFSEFTNPESLDAGAAGEIKKARWKEKSVTLKCLTSNFSEANPDAPKMFLAEIKQLTRIKSFKHVIKFYGHTEDYEGIHYIVMEYAEHSNLRSYLMKNPSIDVEEKLRIAKEIAYGLKAIHDEKISHRDLHSKNILLMEDGTVKIADLGLSKKEGSVQDSLMGGMIAFFEPALFDDRDYKRDLRSDIYAFGVLLWEIWACKPPFHELDTHAIHLAHDLNKGKRETPILGTPKAYVDLYQRCWHGNPQERPIIADVIGKLKNLSLDELWTEQIVDSTEPMSLHFKFGMEPDSELDDEPNSEPDDEPSNEPDDEPSNEPDNVSIPEDTVEGYDVFKDICNLVEYVTKDDIYEFLYHVKNHTCKKEEQDKALQSAAEFASDRNLMEIFYRLSKSGASTQIKTDHERTLLHLLVCNQNLSQETFSQASKWLIENNVNAKSRDKDGLTALHLALGDRLNHIASERINIICMLGADINSRAKSGMTAIYTVLYQLDHLPADLISKTLKILLENDADQNVGIPEIRGFPAFPSVLFAAIHISDEVSILRLLVEYKADLSLKMDELTALEYARKRERSIEYLSELEKTYFWQETRTLVEHQATPYMKAIKNIEVSLVKRQMGVPSNVIENGVANTQKRKKVWGLLFKKFGHT